MPCRNLELDRIATDSLCCSRGRVVFADKDLGYVRSDCIGAWGLRNSLGMVIVEKGHFGNGVGWDRALDGLWCGVAIYGEKRRYCSQSNTRLYMR